MGFYFYWRSSTEEHVDNCFHPSRKYLYYRIPGIHRAKPQRWEQLYRKCLRKDHAPRQKVVLWKQQRIRTKISAPSDKKGVSVSLSSDSLMTEATKRGTILYDSGNVFASKLLLVTFHPLQTITQPGRIIVTTDIWQDSFGTPSCKTIFDQISPELMHLSQFILSPHSRIFVHFPVNPFPESTSSDARWNDRNCALLTINWANLVSQVLANETATVFSVSPRSLTLMSFFQVLVIFLRFPGWVGTPSVHKNAYHALYTGAPPRTQPPRARFVLVGGGGAERVLRRGGTGKTKQYFMRSSGVMTNIIQSQLQRRVWGTNKSSQRPYK